MWDAIAFRNHPDAVVVGVVGSGHVAEGYGIPHQLKDLGVTNATSLVPVSTKEACELVGTTFADAVFTVPAKSADASDAPPPRLGIMLSDAEGGPKISRVVDGSVAAATGLKEGDQVV